MVVAYGCTVVCVTYDSGYVVTVKGTVYSVDSGATDVDGAGSGVISVVVVYGIEVVST